MVSIIAAVARNRIIGRDGSIPWDLPADRRRFRELTMGHPLIMGRKTFESIGKPLPGRRCVVLTRQAGYLADGCTIAGSVEEALSQFDKSEELFVAGGSEIYCQTLALAQRLYISFIDLDCEGDAVFPEISERCFFEFSRELLSVEPPCTLVVYERCSSDCGTL